MGNVTLTKDYSNGSPLTEAQLDSLFDSAETALNITKLDSTNLQNNAAAAGKFAAGAVTTAKIIDGAVTNTKIAEGGIGASTVAANTITQNKLKQKTFSPTGQGLADYVTTYFFGPATYTSSAFTTIHSAWSLYTVSQARAMLIGFIPCGNIYAPSSNYIKLLKNSSIKIKLTRNGTQVALWTLQAPNILSNSSSYIYLPTSGLWFIDVPSAGPQEYVFSLSVVSGVSATISGQICLVEL